jgi:DNA-binding NarL/FixJ family response regulator
MKVFRSPEQLVDVYYSAAAGYTSKEIAEVKHISQGSVATALSQLNKYLKGKDKTQRKRSYNYREAVKDSDATCTASTMIKTEPRDAT